MILVVHVKDELGKELLEVANAQGEGVNSFVAKDLEERWLPHLTHVRKEPIHLHNDEEALGRSA